MIQEGWFERVLRETDFLRRHPGFAGVIARMIPVATTTVPVAAVALRRRDDPRSRLLLLANLSYFAERPDAWEAVLLHEIQHVLLGHLSDPKFHVARHPKVMEIAMEISADELLSGLAAEHGFEVEDFARYGVRRAQSTLERYRCLASAVERGELRLQDHWFANMRDTHRPGRCGAGGAGLGDLLDARSDGASERNWSRGVGLGRPTGRAEIERMKLAIARHLRGDRGGADDPLDDPTRARLAKELRRVVHDEGGRALVDWRRVLREALPRRRTLRPDYRKPNRRFVDRIGEIPGRTRRAPKPSIVVAIDTSGSMTGEILDRIAREVRRLGAEARVLVVEGDAAVHRVYPLAGPIGPVVGGGDTDLVPLIDEACRDPRLDGIVVFTDGRGRLPEAKPALPVIWALTHEDPFLVGYGSVVRVPAV